jgi:hypothetical protein
MIHFQMLGRFANQALQYVLARILADRTGLAYNAPRGFTSPSGWLIWTLAPVFTMQSAPGRRVEGIPQVIDALQWFDMTTIDLQRPVIVRQWFGQRYELLRPYKDQIRNDWLCIPPDRYCLTIDQDAVYVHVRRADYIDIRPGVPANPLLQGTATTIDEYRECLRQFPDAKRVCLIADDVQDPFIPKLGAALELPWSCEWDRWDKDFLRLASARWVILSQSTFSWLAAFLGRPERVVCSVRPGTFWGNGVGLIGPQMGPEGRDFPNLWVDDEPGRWVWLTGEAA